MQDAGAPFDAAPRIGTAGWSVPKPGDFRFLATGTQLERYASRLDAVEINSSFARSHRPATYGRWASSVPEGFRFAVKLPRGVTHERRLEGCEEPLARFLDEVAALGMALGPLLMQLPPSLPFMPTQVDRVLAMLAARTAAPVVCEPRHRSWFSAEVDGFLRERRVARVAADPPAGPGGGEPGGWEGLVYHRLHGVPRVYYSEYDPGVLAGIARRLAGCRDQGTPSWCVFDNTALGHALGDAMTVARMLAGPSPSIPLSG